MRITDFFDCTYIVNLPERKDRRRLILKELKKNHMALIPGKIEIFSAIRPKEMEGFPSLGARGCFLSHLSILKLAKKRGLNNVLIMEDDLLISDKFKNFESQLITELTHNNWAFVYLGHQLESLEKSSNLLQPYSGVIKTTHFYGINGTIFDRVISFLELIQTRPFGHPDGGPMHVDGAYSTFRKQNQDILTLVACPNLGLQQPSRSDLNLKWFDKLPVLKESINLARKLKRMQLKF